jgi:hypothetical protein
MSSALAVPRERPDTAGDPPPVRGTTARLRSAVEPVPSDRPAPTPLSTRHMRGGIEAARDQRHQHRAAGPQARGIRDWHPGAPRFEAAPAPVEMDRWADEGGSLQPEAVTRLCTTSRR